MTPVMLWRVPLQASDPDVFLLSEDERGRATRFRFAPDRDAWIASRVGLRRVLAQTLHCSPSAVQFTIAPGGKPRLASDVDHARVRFSLSHTAHLALVAVSTDGTEVGVDVERIRTDFDPLALAPTVLALDELACLQNIPVPARPVLFFTLWTAKEATLKAEGAGLFVSPNSFSVLPIWERQEVRVRGFRVQSLPVQEGCAAALAFPETPDVETFREEVIWHELCMSENKSCLHDIHS